jgi:hypothetical protein
MLWTGHSPGVAGAGVFHQFGLAYSFAYSDSGYFSSAASWMAAASSPAFSMLCHGSVPGGLPKLNRGDRFHVVIRWPASSHPSRKSSAPEHCAPLVMWLYGFIAPRARGYVVDTYVTMNLLGSANPAAAEWRRTNTPHLFEPEETPPQSHLLTPACQMCNYSLD